MFPIPGNVFCPAMAVGSRIAGGWEVECLSAPHHPPRARRYPPCRIPLPQHPDDCGREDVFIHSVLTVEIGEFTGPIHYINTVITFEWTNHPLGRRPAVCPTKTEERPADPAS